MKPETHYEYLLRTHQEPDSNLESHHIQAPDPRDELLRECAEVIAHAISAIDWLSEQQAMPDPWYEWHLALLKALLAKPESAKDQSRT